MTDPHSILPRRPQLSLWQRYRLPVLGAGMAVALIGLGIGGTVLVTGSSGSSEAAAPVPATATSAVPPEPTATASTAAPAQVAPARTMSSKVACKVVYDAELVTLQAELSAMKYSNGDVEGHAIGSAIVSTQSVIDQSGDSVIVGYAQRIVTAEVSIRNDLLAGHDPYAVSSRYPDLQAAGDALDGYCAGLSDPLSSGGSGGSISSGAGSITSV